MTEVINRMKFCKSHRAKKILVIKNKESWCSQETRLCERSEDTSGGTKVTGSRIHLM